MKLVSRTSGRWLGAALAAAMALAGAPAYAQHADDANVPLPAAGEVIQPFDTQAVDGTPQRVAFEGKGSTVLLFFLSSCPTCHKMIPEWNRAYERRAKNLRVVGVIMDQEPPGFWGTLSVAFPVLRSPGREFLASLHINRAPLTLRVGEGGRIDDLALGIVDPIRLGELFAPPPK